DVVHQDLGLARVGVRPPRLHGDLHRVGEDLAAAPTGGLAPRAGAGRAAATRLPARGRRRAATRARRGRPTTTPARAGGVVVTTGGEAGGDDQDPGGNDG